MTKIQANLRPWSAVKSEKSVGSPWEVYSDNPRDFICITSGNCEANAKLIVSAVNSHDKLVRVAKEAMAYYKQRGKGFQVHVAYIEQALKESGE